MRRVAAIAVAVLLGVASPAAASDLLRTQVSDGSARDSSCTGGLHPDAVQRSLEAPRSGYLTARLSAGGGNWDLAVFRRGGNRPVAGSAYRGAVEVASGYVRAGDDLIVQACRRSGRSARAKLAVELDPMRLRTKPVKRSLVRVVTPTAARKRRLTRLGLDVQEHGGPGFVDVVLRGRRDAAKLRADNFVYTIEVADLAKDFKRARAADRRYAQAVVNSALPSGRDTYRRLSDFGVEMQQLVSRNSQIVKPITLNHPTGEGRPIEGLEITTNPNARDGKPVFLMLGMHHANEWPAAEHPLEWAHDLIGSYRRGVPRAVNLVRNVRTIVIPVVNADGYNASREADVAGSDPYNNENRRKNCRQTSGAHDCQTDGNTGVDPNRNYAGFWGGIGSSTSPTHGNYMGTGPFSEPEIRSVRELVSSRQVVALITNHTSGHLILRQPGVASQGPTPDEPIYQALGDSMAAANGYTSQYSSQLYDHGGTTDAWSYYATGGLAFVFELVAGSSHPAYQQNVDEYDGTYSGAGGNREAYYRATEFAADPDGHAVIRGTSIPGAVLRLRKEFATETQVGTTVTDRLNTTMVVPSSGQYEWHVNQSTRPIAVLAGRREQWTLTCEMPLGQARSSQLVQIARGQALTLNLPCGSKPGTAPAPTAPPVDGRAVPRVGSTAAASYNRRRKRYTVRIRGSLIVPGGLGNVCEGAVTLRVTARKRRVAAKRVPVDGGCGFEHVFRVKARKLPKKLRVKRGLRALSVSARFGGGPHLQPAQKTRRVRVRRR